MLDMAIHIWHQLPLLGRLAGPVTQFLNMLECMSMPQAIILAALGFVGPLQWWTYQFVRLWRTSRVGALVVCSSIVSALQCAGRCSGTDHAAGAVPSRRQLHGAMCSCSIALKVFHF